MGKTYNLDFDREIHPVKDLKLLLKVIKISAKKKTLI